MKKFVLIPDSFKGTMTSKEVCHIMCGEIKKHFPDAEVISIPVADGGEGSVDCFLEALGGERVIEQVSGPFFEPLQAFYGIIDDGKTAVIEMAACAGLPLVEERKNPLSATTYGVGELMLDAAKKGVKKIIIGLGGSATNDGGCGAASAVGIRFYDDCGKEFVPTGSTLEKISCIDVSNYSEYLINVEIITMCDINNPFYGINGAAHVFAPQKGADAEMVQILDRGLVHLADCLNKYLGVDVSEIHGAGAAGGMGGGMIAFFGSTLKMGIETVLEVVEFDRKIENADIVFSGEGKIDTQSIRGKVVVGVARHTKIANVPLVAIVGDIGDDIEEVYDNGVSGIFSINRVAVKYKEAKLRAREDLAATMDNLLKFYKIMKSC